MNISKVTEQEIESVVPLMRAYIVDFYRQSDPGIDAVRRHVAHLIQHPREGCQFVVLERDAVLAFATLYFTYSSLRLRRVAILNDLFVSEQARGQGIGERLFQHCVSCCRDEGYAWMQWETTQDNHVAQRLYDKMGGHISELLHYEIEL